MTLSSMVVSRDWQEISVLECILGSLRINVEVEPRPEIASAKLKKSKIDALIVDCDLNGSTSFLRGVLDGKANTAVPVVILSGSNCRETPQANSATFVFKKPISVEQAVHTLSAARNMILDGRLRYYRETLDLPVWLTSTARRTKAHLVNLSQGGMCVHTKQTLPAHEALQVSFALPGTKQSLKNQGEVVWTNQDGYAGIKFLEMKPRAKRELQLWLERQYLTR